VLLPDDAEELYKTARTLLQLLQAPPPSESTAVAAALKNLSHIAGPATQPRPACGETRGVAMSMGEFASGLAHGCLDKLGHEGNESPGAVGRSHDGDGAMGRDDERHATERDGAHTGRAALSSSPPSAARGADDGDALVESGAPGHGEHERGARKGGSELGAAREMLERARFLDPTHEPAARRLGFVYMALGDLESARLQLLAASSLAHKAGKSWEVIESGGCRGMLEGCSGGSGQGWRSG
jgi:hypothetical protein